MIEKLVLAGWREVRAQAPRVKRWVARLPAGGCVAAVVFLGVGGRAAWVAAHRPAHRQEIATAFGSAGVLYGQPQSDPTGARIAFMRPSDTGLALFVCDTATGERQSVHEQPQEGTDFSMRVWPWSPDGSCFAWTATSNLNIWPADARAPSGQLNIRGLKSLAWLSPDALVCIDFKDQAYLVEKQTGFWKRTALTDILAAKLPPPPVVVNRGKGKAPRPAPPPPRNALAGSYSLTGLSSNTFAWGQGNRIWSWTLGASAPKVLFDMPDSAPATATIAGFAGPGPEGKLLVACRHHTLTWVWQVTPGVDDRPERASGLSGATAPQWLNGGRNGFTYFLSKPDNNTLVLQSGLSAEPTRLFSQGNAETYGVSGDGRRMFITGVVSNEPAAGIWQYEVASGSLRPIVPWTDRPSPAAKRLEPQHGFLTLASGARLNFYLYLPAGFDRHKHRKYPLVIADTVFGSAAAARLYQGRPPDPSWAPAIANCGAYVVIGTRPSWMTGIQNWAENVMAVYDFLSQDPTIDRNRVFLYGASLETQYLSELVEKKPGLWAGLLLLNSTGLPDLAKLPPNQSAPKMLLSFGELEHREESLKRYQANAARYGVPVDYVIHKGATHWLQGVAAVRERTEAMIRFMFDE